jgi:hypothetical protein
LLLYVTQEAVTRAPAPVLPDIFLLDKDPQAARDDPASDLSAEDLVLLTCIEEAYSKRVREQELLSLPIRLQSMNGVQMQA